MLAKFYTVTMLAALGCNSQPCKHLASGSARVVKEHIRLLFIGGSSGSCLNASLRFVSVESVTRRYLLLVYFSIFMQFNIAQASQFVVTMHCISYASNNVFVTSEHVGSMSTTISTRCADDHRRHISAAPTPSGEAACFMKGFSNLAAKTLASWCPRGRRAFLYQRLLTIHFLENTF